MNCEIPMSYPNNIRKLPKIIQKPKVQLIHTNDELCRELQGYDWFKYNRSLSINDNTKKN